MLTQHQKAQQFKSLHERPGLFISKGYRDGQLGIDATLANCREIVTATNLPVSAEVENAFADDPASAASQMLRLVETGVVGGSIEDATGNSAQPIYELALATERVAVNRPLNINMNSTDPSVTVSALEGIGVKRISVGGGLARLALRAVHDAAIEMRDQGTTTWARQTLSSAQINSILR